MNEKISYDELMSEIGRELDETPFSTNAENKAYQEGIEKAIKIIVDINWRNKLPCYEQETEDDLIMVDLISKDGKHADSYGVYCDKRRGLIFTSCVTVSAMEKLFNFEIRRRR